MSTLLRHARLILVAAGILTATLLGFLVTQGRVSTDVRTFFNPGLAAALQTVEQQFAIPRSLHISVEAVDGSNILDVKNLREQDRLFAEVEERWPVTIDSLVTLVNASILRETGQQQAVRVRDLNLQATVDTFINQLYRADPYEFERIARKALSNQNAVDTLGLVQFYASVGGGFVQDIERPHVGAMRATIQLDATSTASPQAVFAEIRDFLSDGSHQLTIYAYSPELIGVDIDSRITANLPWVILLMVLLLGTLLYRTFKSWLFVLMPIGVLAAMLVWAFGIAALLGVREFSFMTLVPIPLLLGQCIDNLIHFSERYREERSQRDLQKALLVVAKTAGRAALLTTIINVSAFAVDMALTNLTPVKYYALIVMLGLTLALVFTYLLGPAAVALVGRRGHSASSRVRQSEQRHEQTGLWVHDWLFVHRRRVMLIGSLLTVGMLVMLTQIDTRYRPTSFMPPGSPVRQAYDFEQSQFALYDPHYVLITGDVTSASVYETVIAVEEVLEGFDDVEHIQQQVNTESLRYLFEHSGVQVSPDALGETLAQLEQSDRILNHVRGEQVQDVFPRIVHANAGAYDATLITYWPRLTDSDRIKAIAGAIESIAHPDDVAIDATGDFLVFSETMDSIVVTAGWAAAATTAIILLVLAFVYRSIIAAALSVIPVLVGTTFGLGMLPILNIELNALNGTIAVLAVGLGIDYAIQLMSRYREELRKGSPPDEAMRTTFAHMLLPLGQAAIFTAAGLFVLTGLLPITGKFGIAAGVALLAAYVTAVTIMPLLAVRWVRR